MIEHLRGFDAAFLYLESAATHMHVAQCCVFDPSTAADGYDFDKVRALIADRLDRVPPFRRRLAPVPLSLGHPVWVDDPTFDLDRHLHRAAVPSPGGLGELADVTAELISQPLDRSRPLWEMHVVEGLEGGMVAGITKVHHSAIDGVSGAELTANLLDIEPEPPPTPPAPPWAPGAPPSALELAVPAVAAMARQPLTALRAARQATTAAVAIRRHNRAADSPPPPAPFTAPATSLTVGVGRRRRVAFTQLALDDVTLVKEAFGATVNDVVMAVCAGALRAYFEERGELPDRPLVAAVPVSVRTDESKATMGNQLSAMLVSLATTIEDPGARLSAIAAGCRRAKEQDRLLGAQTLAGLAELLPATLGPAIGRVAARTGLLRRRPLCNVIVSNFPGPPFPLYCAGARLVAPYPMGPLLDGAALNITLQSYLDRLHVGLVGDYKALPALDELAHHLGDALGELVKLAA